MGTVYTGGTFDLFHSGHVNFLRQCKKIAGEGSVVVALNTDEFIEKFKGKPPIYTYKEREAILGGCKYVDLVYPNIGEQDSKIAINIIHPNFIVVGSDWAKRDYYAQMDFTQKWLDDQGITLIYIPYTEGISTTELKTRITNEAGNTNRNMERRGGTVYPAYKLNTQTHPLPDMRGR